MSSSPLKPSLNLHTLGWHAFQRLCLTICREVLGQTVQSFLDVHDGGRDGAFTGIWAPEGESSISGKFVIQCKFTSRVGHALSERELKDEFVKAKRLVDKGLADVYVLLTNCGLSGAVDEKIKNRLRALGVKNVEILGSTWIEEQIYENSNLRRLVPRVYGLGDLSQILDARAYRQARLVLDGMREDLAKVVPTDAYDKAARALHEHGFVILVGEPACGKSTIAALLAATAADSYESSVVKVARAQSIVDRWNPDEPRQLFWVDDAFGAMQYDASLSFEWNARLSEIKTALNNGAKIVLTSRDYIFLAARRDLKLGAFPQLTEQQVVVDVQALTQLEREQILYNHVRLGAQAKEYRSRLKPLLPQVARHPRFIPEMARRLSDPFFTKNILLTAEGVSDFIEHRNELLDEILEGLDKNSRAALALIYMRNDEMDTPVVLNSSESDAIARLDASFGGVLGALDAMRGSLVLHSNVDGRPCWRFKHPTIGDSLGRLIMRSPDLLDVYIQGAPMGKLMSYATCGDVGVENAVVLPASLFGSVLSKLEAFAASARDWNERWSVIFFLSHRCSTAFLKEYVDRNPSVLTRISSPGLYLDAVPEVRLAKTLFAHGLLPESVRRDFVAAVGSYAVDGEDGEVLTNVELQRMFLPDEFADVVQRVRSGLVPMLDEVRDTFEGNFSSGDGDADGHMSKYRELLDGVKQLFPKDLEVQMLADEQLGYVDSWVSEQDSRQDDVHSVSSYRDYVSSSSAPSGPTPERDIFEDVDS